MMPRDTVSLDQVFISSPVVVLWGPPSEARPVEFVTKNVSQFGYAAGDLTTGNVAYLALLHEEDRERCLKLFHDALLGREDEIRMEYRIVAPNGDARWVEDRTVFHRGAAGEAVAYQSSLLDITERKLSEMRLGESEARLARVLEASRISVWDYFPDKDATFATGRAVLYGDAGDEALVVPGKALRDKPVPPHLRPLLEEKLHQLLSGTVEFAEQEMDIPGPGEAKRRAVAKAYPIRDEQGKVVRIAGLNIDVTRLKETERRIARQNERLALLHSVFLVFMEETDTEKLLGRILEKATELARTEHGRISLLDSDANVFRLVLGRGFLNAMEGEARPSDAGLAGEVLRRKKSVVIKDYHSFPGRIDDPRLTRLTTVIGMPLFQGDVFFGVLSVAYWDVFPEIDEEFLADLDQFAGAVSIALENARLYESARRELKERVFAGERLRFHARLVDAAARASGVLLSEGNREDSLFCALYMLASAANACEAALFRNREEPDGRMIADAVGRSLPVEAPEDDCNASLPLILNNLPSSLLSALAKGVPFHGALSALEDAGELFASLCGASACSRSSIDVVVIPVHLRARFWGFLAFCFRERRSRFDTDEIGVLRSSACALAASVSRWESESQVNAGYENLQKTFSDVIRTMGQIVGKKDPYTIEHQERVGTLASAIGAAMGLDAERCEGLRIAGLVHDVGKIEIAGEILNKPGRLSPIEFELVKTHSQSGYEILSGIDFPWPVAEIARQHHERLDGSGYPRGLKGSETLPEARILAVADVVESMISHRPYRPSLGMDAALEEIKSRKGELYDPEVVDACLELLEEHPDIIDAE